MWCKMESIKFRREQKEIFKYTKGRLAIPAVPGSGKTFILTHLGKKLTLTLEGEEELLVLTYMNSASVTFKKRISNLLGLEKEGRKVLKVKVKTIHQLATELVKEYGKEVGVDEDFNLLSDLNREKTIKEVVAEYRRKDSKSFYQCLEGKTRTPRTEVMWENNLSSLSLKIISRLKNQGITGKNLYGKSKRYRKESLLKIIGEIYNKFEIKCKERGALDYDDILYYGHKILKNNPKLCEELRKRYKYIFEDEAQDGTSFQNKIVRLISNGNLVRVGDINQSILGSFTSSDPTIFKRFIKTAPKVELFTAGRSSREIIEIGNYLIDLTKENRTLEGVKDALLNQKIKPVLEGEFPENPKTEKYGVKTIKSFGWGEEKERILNSIIAFNKKFPEETGGVLLPYNYQINELALALKKRGIPYEILSDIPGELMEFMEFLGDLLGFLSRPMDNWRYKALVTNCYNYSELDRVELERYINRNPMEKIIYGDDEKKDEEIKEKLNLSKEGKREYRKILKKVKGILEISTMPLEEIILFIGDVFNVEGVSKVYLEKLVFELKRILKSNPKWSLLEIAEGLKDGKRNELTQLAKGIDGEYREDGKARITLATYHKSKGMEWDFVCLGGVDNKNFPVYPNEIKQGSYYFLKKEYEYPEFYIKNEIQKEFIDPKVSLKLRDEKNERIRESIRLLYVGLTRGRKYLIISGNVENGIFFLENLEKYIEGRKI